jgi:acyl dehydratase
MFGNLFRLRRATLEAHNENPSHFDRAAAHPSDVRALATGVALATSVDASTAAVVGIYDYAHRYRDRGRRSA